MTTTEVQHAQIVGEVQFRMGDGPLRTIPLGPVEMEGTAQDVTLSWLSGEEHESAAMPRSEFNFYVKKRHITLG